MGNFRSDIQGLRGIAVLIVVFYHAGIFRGGFAGVDIFFVISGFVITQSICSIDGISIAESLSIFFRRRALRILPLLFVFVVVIVFLSTLNIFALDSFQIADSGIYALLSIANLHFLGQTAGYFSTVPELNPFLHTWSLSLEEQIYLLFPLLMFGWLLRIRNRRIAIFFLVLIASASFGLMQWIGLQSADTLGLNSQNIAFYFPGSRLWEFLVGSIGALLQKKTFSDRNQILLCWFGGVLLLLVPFTSTQQSWPGISTLVPVVGTIALLVVGVSESSPSRLVLGDRSVIGRTLCWIGNRSYSLYLWHWPLLLLIRESEIPRFGNLRDIGVIGVSVLLSHITFEGIESRWRNRTLPTRRTKYFALVSVIAGALILASLSSLGGTKVQSDINTREDILSVGGCLVLEQICADEDSYIQPTMFLVGDSHAASLTPIVRMIADEFQIPLVVSAFPGCPFLKSDWGDFIGDFDDSMKSTNLYCKENYDRTLRLIKRTDNPIVIVSEYSARYASDIPLSPKFDRRVVCPINSAGQCLSPNTLASRQTFFLEELHKSILEIVASRGKVIMITGAPLMPLETGTLVAKGSLLLAPIAPSKTAMETVNREKQLWAAQHRNIFLIDPLAHLCDASFCIWSNGVQGNFITAPAANDHLSIFGINKLSPALAAVVEEIRAK